MALDDFHPAVRAWFSRRFGEPTEAQARAWPAIRRGRHALVAAPTGSGKTLAAFLSAIDELVQRGLSGDLPERTHVVYVSPLKALSNDIRKNLEEPLRGIRDELAARGLEAPEIRTLVRTGDTSSSERAAMRKRPPHLLVTTPESLFILLTSGSGRQMLERTSTVIVDEIHALVRDKRGSHLALTLERLEALVGRRLLRIGLSATQRPIEEVARFLVGTASVRAGRPGEASGSLTGGTPDCEIVDEGHRREMELALELPRSPLSAVMSGEVWEEVHDRLAELIEQHRTTLVFVNTRRVAERLTKSLSEKLGEDAVSAHHGSLSKERRLDAEQRLKAGELKALVATASLELGIDIGDVDLACQLGTTPAIATFLQRVGRSGHGVRGVPKGRLFPLSLDELVEAVALLRAVREGELDRLVIPEEPLDILAQQLVAHVADEDGTEDELFELARRAWPFRSLERERFDAVLDMLANGFSTPRGRRAALVHHDAVNRRVRGRRGARLAAITSGGAIPDNADYDVVEEPAGVRVGTINEDFAIESLPGDVFQLGNASWRILKVETGRVRVEDAKGQPPTIPFWLGEAPARTAELSSAVSRLRSDLDARLGEARPSPGMPGRDAQGDGSPAGDGSSDPHPRAFRWLVDELEVPEAAARQVVEYLGAARATLGVLPTQDVLVAERFFDESGGMQLVLHSPFGGRVNRAWGLALRKRFCRSFNFELQAAATEDAIILSLGESHSFPLEDVFAFLQPETARDVLIQALLDAPMFQTRFRWNASRALAVLRFAGGRKVPPQLQRMRSDDLLAAVFPDQQACLENVVGDREIPDHPLVQQTVRDCLEEAMDVEAFLDLLRSVAQGEKRLVARDLPEPSPLSSEILGARPYAFLDDAPLEERRTQAVLQRRGLAAVSDADVGALDPEAVAAVRDEAWPRVESADELHDALVVLGYLTEREAERLDPGGVLLAELLRGGRATRLAGIAGATGPDGAAPALLSCAERLPELLAVHPGATADPELAVPERFRRRAWSEEDALVELVRSRLAGLGPVTAATLAASLALPVRRLDAALARLEAEGFVLRGRFTRPAAGRDDEIEWCERRLLARIQRRTLRRLRREIAPVTATELLRFLVAWQRAEPERRASGEEGLAAILEQLEGYSAAATAWEDDLLPARVAKYDPAWLDRLCLSGRFAWGRLAQPRTGGRAATGPAEGEAAEARSRANGSRPVRSTPIAFASRETWRTWTGFGAAATSEPAPRVSSRGRNAGAAADEGGEAVNDGAGDGAAGGGLPPGARAPERLTPEARAVLGVLREQGASFLPEIVTDSGLLPSQVEQALGELVALGVVSCDAFAGLRALLEPASKRTARERRRRRPSAGVGEAGRWARLRRAPAPPGEADAWSDESRAEAVEQVARALLRRYGVVFRRIVERETALPPWRELLWCLRRMEVRGEVRGGRFVERFAGEQFALPEAVGLMRSLRRTAPSGELVVVSGSDPLNLVGVLTPGERLAALPGHRLVYRDGVAVARLAGGEPEISDELAPAERWEVEKLLLQRPGRVLAVRRERELAPR